MDEAKYWERRRWLGQARIRHIGKLSGRVFSSHALLLMEDMNRAFCAGAWLSVIVGAYAITDSTLRDIVTGVYNGKIDDPNVVGSDLCWLRSLRNKVVHVGEPGSPSNLWRGASGANTRDAIDTLEDDAKRAVEIAFRCVGGERTLVQNAQGGKWVSRDA